MKRPNNNEYKCLCFEHGRGHKRCFLVAIEKYANWLEQILDETLILNWREEK